MKSFYYRVPAIVCAAISVVALLGSLRQANWWQPVFFAFLPACFLYMTSVEWRTHRKISQLRRRIARLEQHDQDEPASSAPRSGPARSD